MINNNIYKEKNSIKDMEDKKRVAILVTIALILAVTAIALNVMDSKEVPVSGNVVLSSNSPGQMGIQIQTAPVEDKLTQEETQGAQA